MDKLLEEIKSPGKFQKSYFDVQRFVFVIIFFLLIFYRLVQYLSRAIYDSLQQANISSDLVEKLKSFEYILSSFRKCTVLVNHLIIFKLIVFSFSVTTWKMCRRFLLISIINSQSRYIAPCNFNSIQNFSSNFSFR